MKNKFPGVALIFAGLLAGCASPHKVDVALPDELPHVKTTEFDQSLRDLGLMTQIYATPQVRIMARDILDNTGANLPTSAEIPRDVTEMLKSTLNAIGGNVRFIPYDPDFMLNSASTGYSGFKEKLLPDVVVVGGITEFDRGLESRGKNTDVGLDGTLKKNDIGAEFSYLDKTSVSSISLDFNMIDFQSLAGIPRIQAINTIRVHKALAEDSMAFSIIGNALGLKGTVKKVQGRHAAVRVLVQLSMIQVTGKYLQVPYWRLIPGGEEDPVVIDQIVENFYTMDENTKVRKIQEYLALSGYDVSITGQFDEATQTALSKFSETSSDADGQISKETYLALFRSVPLNYETLSKRKLLDAQDTQTATRQSAVSEQGLLRLSTNGTTFRIGEEIKLSFAVSAPLYVRVYNVSSNGEIAELFPTKPADRMKVRPGQDYPVPSPDAGFKLEVTGPVGVDRIIALASKQPLPDDFSMFSEDGAVSGDARQSAAALVELPIAIESTPSKTVLVD